MEINYHTYSRAENILRMRLSNAHLFLHTKTHNLLQVVNMQEYKNVRNIIDYVQI